MSERPILFSAPMIRAILSGTKTQTRRIVKLQPPATVESVYRPFPTEPNNWQGYGHGLIRWYGSCPYGVPGNRLWVREPWAQEHPIAVQAGRYSQDGRAGIPGPPGVTYRVVYRADGEPLQVWRNASGEHPYFTIDGPADDIAAQYPTVSSNYTRDGKAIYWTPAIHMPRWASRITLGITEVRVQRLQDINEEDAKAEGLDSVPSVAFPRERAWCDYHIPHDSFEWFRSPIDSYRSLWDSINGKRVGCAWADNPWVWCITFARQFEGKS